MTHTNWDAAKLQYEVFGATPTDLATKLGVPLEVVEYAIETQHWQVRPDALDSATSDLVDTIKERAEVARTLSDATLSPEYIKLEAAILAKANEMIDSLPVDGPNSAKNLEIVASVLKSLREQNGTTLKDKQQSGLTVKIMNQVDYAEETSTTGVQVEISPQQVN